MNIFFYTSKLYETRCALRNLVEDQFPTGQIVTISTVSEFSSAYLGRAIRNDDLVIMAIEARSELDELLTFRFLFDDVRLVILLARFEEESLAKAHLLRPRYLSVGDCDPNQICAVIHKMLNIFPSNAPLSP
jgi:hypothetical protein